MPFDGSGNFNRVHNWTSDAAASIKIKADRHDAEDDNLASGLSNTLTKDGQSQPTANIPMNGKKLVNLGAPTNPTDAATKGYADALRNFNTAINLTGAVPEARIGFTGADLGFGARVAGTPAGSLNRFVWNDKPDLSGSDIAVMDDTGRMALGMALPHNNLSGSLITLSRIFMRTGWAINGYAAEGSWYAAATGYFTNFELNPATGAINLNRSPASVAAGAQANPTTLFQIDAAGRANFFGPVQAENDGTIWLGKSGGSNVVNLGVGASLAWAVAGEAWTLYGGGLTVSGYLNTSGASTITAGNGVFAGPAAQAILACPAGTVYLRPNGIASATGQFSVQASGRSSTAEHFQALGGAFIGSAGTVILGTTAALGGIFLRPNGFASGTGQGVYDGNGNLVIAGPTATKASGTTWANPSDERIKDVVGDYETGLAEIVQLQPRRFTYKGNDTTQPPGTDPLNPEGIVPLIEPTVPYPDSPHYQMAVDGTEVVGFVAQEVETVMPGMVSRTSGYIDGEAVTDFRFVDTNNLSFALVNAVKELATRVEALEAAA
jgi:Chaperone of endosialidase